jgi:pyruvate kinase
MKRTKIIATIGPSSDSLEMLEKLIRNGVDVFRLNFSHGDHSYHLENLKKIRQAIAKSKKYIAVLQDISGPKIRVGDLEEPFELKQNDILEFVKDDILGKQVDKNRYILTINQKDILDKIKEGEYIYLYDGIIRAEVISTAKDKVMAKIENDGRLTSRKGVNFPHSRIDIDVLTQKDKEDIKWGVENGVDFMAISFVQNAKDMINARNLVKELGGDTKLIAKIEKFDAVENIDEILQVSDGLMVARGDLGIEVPYHKVPIIQKELIYKANEASKPVIVATQMLLSMTNNERATRAEISDVANAVLDGADAVMLSEESAIGIHPDLVVETMVNTIKDAQKIYFYNRFDYYKEYDEMDLIDESAVRLADSLNADALLSTTTSGGSARKLARYRPKMPIYAIVHNEKTARELALSWGIEAKYIIPHTSFSNKLETLVMTGLNGGYLDKDKRYILTAGNPMGVAGTTNVIRILGANEFNFFMEK